MGQAQVLANAVTAIIAAVGDIAVDIVYYRVTQGSYNSATDVQGITTSTTNIKGILYRTEDDEQAHVAVVRKTSKLLIASQGLSFVPDTGDHLTIAGRRYEITDVRKIPSNPGYILMIRVP